MNSEAVVVPKLASPWRSAIALVFQICTYVDTGLAHELAVNLKAKDLAAAHERGEFPKQGWQTEARERICEQATHLRSGLLGSFLVTLAFLATGLALAVVAGKVSPEFPIAIAKLLGVIGGGLAAWATLFALGGYAETYGGEALHEVVHPVLFKCIFLPGVAMAVVGQLW